MKPNFYLYEKTALTLKTLAISFIFAGLSTSAFSQGSYTSLGVGYNIADYTMPGFSDLLDQINVANPGLTKSFTDDHNYSGFNLHMGFGNKKSCFTIQYARYNKKHTAEGIIPLISPNNATYSIGAHHNFFTFQYQVFPVRFIGLGAHFGYGYSTLKMNKRICFSEKSMLRLIKKVGEYMASMQPFGTIGQGLKSGCSPLILSLFIKWIWTTCLLSTSAPITMRQQSPKSKDFLSRLVLTSSFK
ncbi:MAG: hypothetical protein IPO65_15080 [Saprospiraceae bacterium]|nr:hypothetical protein [Saprospiraceae bacterium]